MQTGLEQTCVAPSTRGLVGAGLEAPKLWASAALCVCVWVWGGAGCWEGKAHVGLRGRMRGVGQTARGRWVLHPRGWSPRVGGEGLWLSPPLRRVPCSR